MAVVALREAGLNVSGERAVEVFLECRCLVTESETVSGRPREGRTETSPSGSPSTWRHVDQSNERWVASVVSLAGLRETGAGSGSPIEQHALTQPNTNPYA